MILLPSDEQETLKFSMWSFQTPDPKLENWNNISHSIWPQWNEASCQQQKKLQKIYKHMEIKNHTA